MDPMAFNEAWGRRKSSIKSDISAVFCAWFGLMAYDGAGRSGTDPQFEKSRVCHGGESDRRVDYRHNLSSPDPECPRTSDRLRYVDHTKRDADRSVPLVSWPWRSSAFCLMGKPRSRRCEKHRHLSLAVAIPGPDNGI